MTPRSLPAAIGLFVGVLALAACNSTSSPPACTLEARAGINLTVLDDVTGQPVANATATAREGDFVETLQSFQAGELSGAYERQGRYEVTVSAPGHETWRVEDVVVEADECHVIPVRLTARLEPAS